MLVGQDLSPGEKAKNPENQKDERNKLLNHSVLKHFCHLNQVITEKILCCYFILHSDVFGNFLKFTFPHPHVGRYINNP